MTAIVIDWDLIGPPLAAGLLVSLTHIPLGRQVLKRGIIFIDLAIAQIAALGVLAATLGGTEPSGPLVQFTAVGSALLGALWLRLCERWWPEIQEALIGVTFVLAASASLLLLAHNPHGAEHMRDLLTGQILWVSYAQLGPVTALYAGVLILLGLTQGRQARWSFYVCFALAVTASVQLIGVYLVFATLILPALAIRRVAGWTGLLIGYAVGVLGYAVGLLLSSMLDLPAGPLVIWVLAVAAMTVAALGTLAGRLSDCLGRVINRA